MASGTERERGEVTTTVLAVPIAMFLILVIVQAGLVSHGQAVVDAAAQDGAAAGQGEFGTEAAARSAAQAIVGTSAGTLLSDVQVYVRSRPGQRSVTVQATVTSLIPGYTPAISSTATGPREVFRP
ncbi:TadE/TadG family type IV pilus assembly protein [Candidatus Poriferisocius sp.]|uniref:TadE/TadG family type IV pilus assembly protein n=1 Tax=Candidatus Poriferisocius sp. TaxID=3101276 RepID=UPI003B59A2B5